MFTYKQFSISFKFRMIIARNITKLVTNIDFPRRQFYFLKDSIESLKCTKNSGKGTFSLLLFMDFISKPKRY